MATFTPIAGGFSQAQKSATTMDGKVQKNPSHPQVLIPAFI